MPPSPSSSNGGFDWQVFGWFNSTYSIATLLHKEVIEVRRMGLEVFILTDVYQKCTQYQKIKSNEH